MAKIITLKYAGKCADCGAELPAGSRARWYGRGKIYGLDCHQPDEGAIPYRDGEPPGQWHLGRLSLRPRAPVPSSTEGDRSPCREPPSRF